VLIYSNSTLLLIVRFPRFEALGAEKPKEAISGPAFECGFDRNTGAVYCLFKGTQKRAQF
jgi:hypothetical protein